MQNNYFDKGWTVADVLHLHWQIQHKIHNILKHAQRINGDLKVAAKLALGTSEINNQIKEEIKNFWTPPHFNKNLIIYIWLV